MKVCVITAVWKRPEIFEIFAQAVKALDGDISVCVAGSEGSKSKKMVEAHGFQYVEAPNDKLGFKMNQAAIMASQSDADYYLLMGSDDIINQALYNKYLKIASKGFEYVYIKDCYFYDTVSKTALYWSGYSKHNRLVKRSKLRAALGCGRFISKRLMQRAKWQPWYNHKMHHILDTAFDEKMKMKEPFSMSITIKDTDMAILDIKSSTNMTPFEMWENTRNIDPKAMLNKFFPKLKI